MNSFFIYSLKVSVCLSVVYLFYYGFLQSLTFYKGNRWFLLVSTTLCLIVPRVPVLPFLESEEANQYNFIRVLPPLRTLAIFPTTPADLNFWQAYLFPVLQVVFYLGLVGLIIRLFIQFISFFCLVRSAKRIKTDQGAKIFQVHKNIAPFSFGNAIFFNKDLLQPPELQEIFRRELVHVRQKHTLDVLWFEALCLLNWYNPLVWLLRQASRQNLEFIADSEVLRSPQTDKRYYQFLLLKITGGSHFQIAHPFNLSPLKTRIIMMNKMPSTKRNLVKYLFALPLMAGLLLACQNTTDSAFPDLSASQKVLPPPPPPLPAVSEMPPPPPPVETKFEAPFIVPDIFPADHKEFMKRNPKVKLLAWNMQGKVLIYLKSGEEELYDLTHSGSETMAAEKYGKLPKSPYGPPFAKFNKQGERIN